VLAYFAQISDEQGLGIEPAAFWKAWLEESEAYTKERGRAWDTLDGPIPELEPFRVTWPVVFERTFRTLGVEGEPHQASDYMRRSFAEAGLYEDVLPAFERLRHAGLPMTVLSNADHDFLLPPLERHGLDFFAYVDSSETAKAYKPHRRAFEHAAERLSLPLEALMYVGDSPVSDVTGAHHAGMIVTWINRRGTELPEGTPEPHLVIESLMDLVELFGP
jgi:2-haloacid dehalogenase/putative hydrolase of the HAD superfamily